MKALTTTLGLFFLSMFVFNSSMAQKASFTSPGGITIGLGAGYAYQKSDLANSKGHGFDFTIGTPLYHKENVFLGVDWKFRFLAGGNKAYDHRINPDNTYSNIRYSFFNYDLEVGLTLNRLRERTGIVLTGFAGAGITHGRTYTDLYDAGNNLYDFGGINPDQDSKLIYKDLVALSDGNFETRLVNKASFLPTAGLFLGYQFSRSFTLGIEFKTNFYLTEKNSFTGIDLDNRALSGSGMDRNNYVSLGLRWNLRGGSSHQRATNNYATGVSNHSGITANSNNPEAPGALSSPSVNITDPFTDPYRTGSTFYTIKATIKNVSGPESISFVQNGFPNHSFTYNADTKIFVANVRLNGGENSIRIKASNQVSAVEDMATIILDNPLDATKPPPLVEFISPQGDQFTSYSDRMDVTASVKNIRNKEDIQLTLNGSSAPFEYYPVSGLVKISVQLAEGNNNLFINGLNESGSAQDQLAIYFNEAEKMAFPTIRYIHPATPAEVMENRFPLSAEIQNVHGRNDITVRLNGSRINNFYFDANGMVSVSLLLTEGDNTMEITARNEAGLASESTYITYHAPVQYASVRYDPVFYEPAYHAPVNFEQGNGGVLNVESVNREQVTREEVIYDPVNREGGNRGGVTRGPVIQEPVTQGPVTQGPVTQGPVTQGPVIKRSPPVIHILSPATNPSRTDEQSGELRAKVLNVNSKNNITLIINGLNSQNFKFDNGTKVLTARFGLQDGENAVTVSAKNESGSDSKNQAFIKETRPCTPPTVSFSLHEMDRNNATHELSGSVSGVLSKADISLTLDGRTNNGFQFSPATGDLSATFTLTPGSHTVVVSANNDCGKDSRSQSVTLEAAKTAETVPGGIRINPGNADWQFCMTTTSGTISRENLTNENFSYSGPASSLYFMPIGGGGEATVNGKPYSIKSGQYYLFTGNLRVTVSTKNPGSMGQWSLSIIADREPVTGNGQNRPKSPCEMQEDVSSKVKGNRR